MQHSFSSFSESISSCWLLYINWCWCWCNPTGYMYACPDANIFNFLNFTSIFQLPISSISLSLSLTHSLTQSLIRYITRIFLMDSPWMFYHFADSYKSVRGAALQWVFDSSIIMGFVFVCVCVSLYAGGWWYDDDDDGILLHIQYTQPYTDKCNAELQFC